MTEAAKKRVLRHGVQIGEAASWGEAEAVLIAYGLEPGLAKAERWRLGIEGRDTFEIVTPAAQDTMMAEVRRIQATRSATNA